LEKIMSKTNETSHDELTINELDTVSGGVTCVGGQHFDEAIIDVGGGGGGATPASAWNACLGVFGFGPQAK
jgi:bacteriocin-like protein